MSAFIAFASNGRPPRVTDRRRQEAEPTPARLRLRDAAGAGRAHPWAAKAGIGSPFSSAIGWPLIVSWQTRAPVRSRVCNPPAGCVSDGVADMTGTAARRAEQIRVPARRRAALIPFAEKGVAFLIPVV